MTFKLTSAHLSPKSLLALPALPPAVLLLPLPAPSRFAGPTSPFGGQGSPQAEVPFVSFNFSLKENTKLAQTSVPAAPKPLNPLLHRMKGR